MGTVDPRLRNRLTRYLHTGNEDPKYFPGCWNAHKYFEEDKLKVIDEILADGVDNYEVINIILEVYHSGFCTRFETIAFALIKCLLAGSYNIKEAAYKAASQICTTPEQLLLFNKFTRVMKTGNGRGWCRHVKEWYMYKDPMELAKEMTRVRGRFGRSHKTLIRKSHLKLHENDYARDAVIKYSLFGLSRAKEILGNAEGTKEIFDYIQIVESMRVCEDPEAAAIMASTNNFTIDHVPGHLLTSQVVWNAVLPQFSLRELLYNILRLHNMGFLSSDSDTTAILISMLSNDDIIKKSDITPIEVYITICNYKKKSRPMKFEKAKSALEKQNRRRTRQYFDTATDQWEWTITRRHPREAKVWGIEKPPNPAVISALTKLLDETWLLTKPTKARYLITLDMRHHMFKGRHFCKHYQIPKTDKKVTAKPAPTAGGDTETEKKESKKHLQAECFYNNHVTPGHAGIILALQLLKREKRVKLAVFTDDGIQIVSLERNFGTIEEAEFILRKANLGSVQMDAPMAWAMKTKERIDVFINMVDRPTRYMELEKEARGGRGPGGRYGPPPNPEKELTDHCPVRALQRYRDEVRLPRAKLIVMSLASHRVATTDGSHEGVLDIIGVDEHVPKVMDAFVLGQFQ